MPSRRNRAAKASGDRSIAAAGSIRQAFTGDGTVAHYVEKALTLPPEALELPRQAPPNMVNLPERVGLFVGRAPELARLDEAFEGTGGVVVQAVHGLGGIGKSTLAAKWAAGRTGSFNPVWWITAETPLELEAGLAGLAVALQPALRDVLSQEALAERAVQWLAAHEGWLLVLDNVSDPAEIRPLLGRTTGGRLLITSRRASGWQGIAEPLSLDVLEPSEAVELFERIYGGPADGIEELCGELGFLPLAVEQAAAYCAEACIAPGAYRELLARYPERIFANAAEGGDGERTIARVWRVTMDRLADTPLAETILRVIAWWAPDGIPRAYVEPLGDEPEVTDALRRLAAHSMIGLHEDGTISVHRLVQAVSRTGEGGVRDRDVAAQQLLTPDGAMGSAVWIKHAESLAEHAREGTPSEVVLLVNAYIGAWYTEHLSLGRATKVYEDALTGAESVLGRRSATTLLLRKALAHRCQDTGDPDRALRLLTENLTVARDVFGRKDSQTIDTHTDLALLKLQLGDLDGGLSLATKNVRRAERALGGEDWVTLRAKQVVAKGWRLRAQSDSDRYAERAAAEIERLLVKMVRSDDASSDRVMWLLWELSGVREAAGDLAEAIRLIENAMERRSAPVDGIDMTGLVTRHRIVRLLQKAGELDRARELAIPLLTEVEEQGFDGDLGGEFRDSLARLVTPADDT